MEEHLEKKTKKELIQVILSYKPAQKAFRNEMIKKEFDRIKQTIPIMQAYTNLSITHGISERSVIEIIRNDS